MTLESWGTLLVSILAGVALAAATGLRAFLPLFVLAVGARLGLVTLNERVAFLATNVSLIGLGVAMVLEMAGDKIPLVDHALDVAGTFVRPAAGFLTGMVVLADFSPPLAAGISLVLAVITLGTHLGHAKARVGSTLFTAGLGNPVLSVLEDLVSGVVAVIAVLIPVLAALIAVGVLVLIWRLGRKLRPRGVAAGLALLVASSASAQEPMPIPVGAASAGADTASAPADTTGHRSKLSAYPYAYYTPETQFAIGGGGIWTFYSSEYALLRPSRVSFSGYVSTTGQYQLTLEPGVYFSKNKNYARMKMFFGHYVDRFYGVGNDSPDLDVEEYGSERYGLEMELQIPPLLLTQDRTGIIVDLQNFNVIDKKENPYLQSDSLTGSNGGFVSGVGFNFVVDQRDNTFFPTSGVYSQSKAIFYSRSLGSDFTFQNFDIDVRRYMPLKDGVLGVNMRFNAMGGNPPFFRLPALGGQRLMRGYYEGRYRDMVYTAGQVEYRRYFKSRWAFVTFLSAGEVAASISAVKLDALRLAGGAGLRFLIDPKEKVNVRADIGFGKDTNGVYFGIEEAF